jgi:hypothetical protein
MTVPAIASRGRRPLRHMIRLRFGLALAALGVVGVFGFATAASVPPPAGPLALPVTFLELMRATIEPSTGGIWGAQAAEALADEDWLLVEKDAIDLVASATLLIVPGAGPKDAEMAAAPDWRAWSLDLQQAAMQIRAAATAKDVDKLNAAADRMSDLCLACHAKYYTEGPSDGVSRYPFYPARVRGQ